MKYWLFLSNKFSFPYELKVSSFLYYSICTIWKERIRCSFYCNHMISNRWTCFFKYFAWTFLKICSLPNTNKKKKDLRSNPPDLTGRLPILHILSWPSDECNNLPIPAQKRSLSNAYLSFQMLNDKKAAIVVVLNHVK